jgi:hypothetical protein
MAQGRKTKNSESSQAAVLIAVAPSLQLVASSLFPLPLSCSFRDCDFLGQFLLTFYDHKRNLTGWQPGTRSYLMLTHVIVFDVKLIIFGRG